MGNGIASADYIRRETGAPYFIVGRCSRAFPSPFLNILFVSFFLIHFGR
jgi:hypothetical protein